MADPTGPDPAPTDASLLGRFRRGEGDAATELYLRYARRLRAVAEAQTAPDLRRRLDPDDIVQSVFRTFFRRAAAGQYDVPAGEELWKLFLVIGLNKVRAVAAHHRAAKRDVAATGGDITSAAAPESDDESLTALRLTIDEILARLPPAYREVVELRVAGHEVAEIAAQTGRAKRSVERILQEFRESLRGQVNEPD
ncbi:RNA polymerase sigma factor [Urbifossiella limnaea]|uniref:RNA polymerase sigma factor n=1 Tax=Urbifossiella limnaea TaxID=2528023 RepID=A0A517XUV4_9BACT|nr:sigma-70 family RNA polymerase sigma factor [Urbifossiella limnaea]QDU21291.1 RNA polymerase sigma factor [Urbifossiella limnaea]